MADRKIVFRGPSFNSLPFAHRGLIPPENGVVKISQDLINYDRITKTLCVSKWR